VTNLVQITVKASDSSAWSDISAKAAKAGAQAADAFNAAFKLKADASASATERLKESGGLGGKDTELMNKLRSYANTPGGIGILGTGNDTSLMSMLKNQIRQMGETGGPGLLSTGAGGQSTTDMIKQVMVGNGPSNVSTEDIIRQVMEGSGPSNVTTKDLIQQVLTGNAPGNVTTKDLIDQILQGTGPSNVTTKDFISQVIEGKEPGNIDTKDIIHPTVDDTDIKDLGEKDGKTYGGGFASSLKDALSSAFGAGSGGGMSDIGKLLTGGGEGGEGDGGALGGISSALNSGGVAGGALPGIGGVSGMAATVTGLAAALVAVLPAITAVAGGLASIGGGFAILEETDTKFAASMSSTLSSLEGVFKAAAMPLAQPLEQAATQIVGYFKQIEPDLKQVFGDSAQLIQPLVKGFESLMSGAGPGFLAMIKAAGPVFTTVGQAFANLGKSLGEMFQDFASDGGASATVLKALLEIVNSLLPFIGKLGELLVSALAPAFLAFSNSLSKVLPALTPLLSILGDFAGAVLTDLASVLGALGALLIALAPSFKTLTTVAAQLFNTMENTGIFAILGDALENLAQPIGKLINALVGGLAPAIPPIIELVSQLSGILVTLISAGLGAVITVVAKVIQTLSPMLPAIVDVIAAVKAWTLAQAALNVILDLNPFIAITAAIIALVGIVITYHTQIWDFIQKIWNDVESFCKQVWQGIEDDAQIIWGAMLDTSGAGLIYKYHEQIWTFIQTIWKDVESFLKGIWGDTENDAKTVWNDINDLLTTLMNDEKTGIETIWNDIYSFLRGIWDDIESAASSAWHNVESTASSAWNSVYSTVKSSWGTIVNFFKGIPGDITSALGNLSNLLIGAGKDVITGFENGAKDIWNDVVSFFKGLPKDILDALGIASPPDWAISAGEDIMEGLGIGMQNAQSKVAKAVAAMAKATAQSAQGVVGSNLSNEQTLEALAAQRGWTGAQWQALYDVEMAEAGFSLTATNPSSGAYGMAQFINGPSEYYTYGGNPNTAAGQSTAMLNYIAERYGTPEAAWAHEEAYHWYDQGGWLPTGKSIAVNNTGRPEYVVGPGGINVTLEMASSGNADFDAFMATWIKKYVRLKGGKGAGATDRAFTQS
jgi:phage-related protein